MKTFKGRGAGAGSSPRRPGTRPPFKRSFSAAGGPARDTTLFDATCSACHKPCKVPFAPNGRKPVYCRECFIPKADTPERGARPSFDKSKSSRFASSEFAPRSSYPRPTERAGAVAADTTAKQLSDLTAKVDKILRMMEKLSQE